MAAVNDEELVDAYCDGELRGEECLHFELRLATEPELLNLLRQRERLGEGLQFLFRDGEPAHGDLLTSCAAILSERSIARRRSRRRVLGLLAGVCGAAVLGGSFMIMERRRGLERWRQRILLALEPGDGSVHLSVASALLPQQGGFDITYRDDRHWRIEAARELPLPAWLSERRGEPYLVTDDAGELALGRSAGELWFHRPRRSLLFVWEDAPLFSFWPKEAAGPLGELSALRQRLLRFARGEEVADEGHCRDDGALVLQSPGNFPILVEAKGQTLIWHFRTKCVLTFSRAGVDDSFRPRAQDLVPRRRPWSDSPL